MLQIDDLTIRFGGLTAVDRMALTLPERGVFALIGPNGAGKTTLLNAISRFCSPSSGHITMHGQEISRLPRHKLIGLGIARSFQTAALFPGLTVLENVMVGLHRQIVTPYAGFVMAPKARRTEAAARERAENLLAQFDLWPYRDVPPGELPYGFQKLLDVARALVSGPKLLLLDEPFAGVTRMEEPRLLDCIVKAGETCAILMIEHDFDTL